ncbi:MAG: type II toxin-antitoxin system mRNA interferase toxin, RelE/StbE family [SAR86 cluster bacterium]|uniref:Type II toxin-antitoxin system mRNA interferase toxin, RelE/StbE family n=1 Tax=SAR86 cluster bacterium TaxID=2030880 RepID=A0A2A4MLQ2_9GAMM|nr:MAG: type II toxin-antitoxin system mRNA interferase toxin, RelE/StbE family [SAR86 cluster bacterium]
MWQIYEHKRISKQTQRLPDDILKRYEKWKDIVRISGPLGLRVIRGFNDESLHGEWRGYRLSRLNLQYRVIYKIERDEVLIQVVQLTPHDYRRS